MLWSVDVNSSPVTRGVAPAPAAVGSSCGGLHLLRTRSFSQVLSQGIVPLHGCECSCLDPQL